MRDRKNFNDPQAIKEPVGCKAMAYLALAYVGQHAPHWATHCVPRRHDPAVQLARGHWVWQWLLAVFLFLLVSPPAQGQPLVGSTVSLEAKIARADIVVVGKIVELDRREDKATTAAKITATIAVEQTLKGKHQDRLSVQVSGSEASGSEVSVSAPMLDHWRLQASRLMLFVDGTAAVAEPIDLADPDLEIMTADFAVLRKADDVIRAAEAAGHLRGKRTETFSLPVPHEVFAGTSWRYRGTELRLTVPVDDRLQLRAIEFLRSKTHYQRYLGAQALGHFKSEENIARLKAMLSDTGYSYLEHAETNAGIEVRHYGVREGAYAALEAWGVTVPKPVVREAVVKSDIDRVWVGEMSDETLRRLQGCPKLRAVHCEGNVNDDGLRRLARLKQVAQLEVTGNKAMTDAGAQELKALTKLTTLRLNCPNVTDEGLRGLAALTNLDSLDVTSSKVDGRGFKDLSGLTKLTDLSLHNTRLNDEGLKQLARLTSLQTLGLSGTGITDAGLKELAPLKNLATLDLSGTQVTDAGLTHLAPLRKLTTIEIWSNSVSDTTLRNLREIDLLHALPIAKGKEGGRAASADEVLEMNLGPPFGTKVTDAGLAELAGLKNLARLNLPAGVTDAGLKVLGKLENLTDLHQGEAQLSDDGLRELGRIKKLKTLYIRLTDARLRLLREMGLLHVLRGATGRGDARPKSARDVLSLDLRHMQVFDEGFQELAFFTNLAERSTSPSARSRTRA